MSGLVADGMEMRNVSAVGIDCWSHSTNIPRGPAVCQLL